MEAPCSPALPDDCSLPCTQCLRSFPHHLIFAWLWVLLALWGGCSKEGCYWMNQPLQMSKRKAVVGVRVVLAEMQG